MKKKLLFVAFLVLAGAGIIYVTSRTDQNPPQSSTASPPNTSQPQEGQDKTPGEAITVTGTYTCLPHKNTEGPQTLECALGMQTAEGTYYALRDTSADYSLLGGVATNQKITVTGTLRPNPDTIYQDSGIISVTKVEEVE